jgi:hypothetical protein
LGVVEGSLCSEGQVSSASLSRENYSEKHDGVVATLYLKYCPGCP